jgi:hypothetical protein
MPECPPVRTLAEAKHFLYAAIAVCADHKDPAGNIRFGILDLQHDVMVEFTLFPVFQDMVAAILLAKDSEKTGQCQFRSQEAEILRAIHNLGRIKKSGSDILAYFQTTK